MVQCDYPSYNLKTLEWVKALKNDMDNIFSYCKDMYDDANIMLLEIQKQWIYKSKAQNESSSTLVQ